MSVDVAFDRYYGVEEMDEALHRLAAAHPRLAKLESVGRSHEGRDIWLMTVNDSGRGPDTDKPAYWIDGNIHASEVAGSMAALHAIHWLLTGYGTDETVTRLLERMAFYVVPRISPDGAARLFATPPRDLRSSARPYPWTDLQDGLHEEDVDGDGRILAMRIQDPTGNWKVADEDPRVMVRRGPTEEGGTYYRIFPEGMIRNFDGHTIRAAPPLEGLDLNRNFPTGWEVEAVQRGAGPFPLSEPETRALADFIGRHRNIVGSAHHHTTGGIFFRPSSFRPDSEMPMHDLEVYRFLDRQTRALTGRKTVATYHEFSQSSRATLHGGFLDWMYDDLGIFSVSPELWDYVGQAGVERKDEDGALQGWFYDHPVEDDLKIMRWLDDVHGGKGFVEWHPFDHPQLGRVEIGGWDGQFLLYNPPPDQLESELRSVNRFCFVHAALAPWLQVRHLAAEQLGDATYRVVLVVENAGFLRTSGSEQAEKRGAVRPIRVRLEGAELLGGQAEVAIGQLEGRSNKLRLGASSATDNRARCEWVVRAPAGTEIAVHVCSDRAGSLHATLSL